MKPYIICHMLSSIDGKVTGKFLEDENVIPATNIYYEINRNLNADCFICGRGTMESSFTHGFYPKLSKYANVDIDYDDYVADNEFNTYAVAMDRYGKLGWVSNIIEDEDPGYDKHHIIEVLTKSVKKEYLAYLKDIGVSYIFAGDNDLDISLAMTKLYNLFNIKVALLEGGSIINGTFLKTDLIDEISLVIAPITAEKEDKSVFYDGNINYYKIKNIKKVNDIIILNYKRV